MNITSSSFAGFILNNDAGTALIRDVRSIVKENRLVVRIFARNKNRKKHAKTRYQRMRYRQHLPVEFASHYGIYIYRDHKKSGNYEPSMIVHAKIVFETVKKIYEMNGHKVSP